MWDQSVWPVGRIKSWGMVALIYGLVLTCYWPALHGGLVWDDEAHVTRPELRSWAGLERIWLDLHATQQYYPVLHSAFWVESQLWGDAVLGYHLVNVIWHATSCCLLALMLRRLGVPRRTDLTDTSRAIPAGTEWAAAAIFAVHPVCVESVAWITEQKNTLSLMFYLLAGLAYLDFESKRRVQSYGLATIFYLLALGTKTVTATLPAALLVAFWWRNGRLSWRRDVAPLIPWFFVALVAGLFTAWVERKLIGAEGAGFDLTAVQRVLLAGRVGWFYLGKLVWPADLMFIYPRWDVANAAHWYGWLGGTLVVTILLWLIRRHFRGPLAGWLFFYGSLFPVLGFLNVYPFVFSFVADHFQYLASLGVIVTITGGAAHFLAGSSSIVRGGGRVVCCLLVAVLAYSANQQSRVYANGEALYRATLALNPDCWMAHNNLAIILAQTSAGEAEAVAHYRAALKIRPDYAEAHNNLAIELAKMPGHEFEAMQHCERALQIHPDYAEAHCNLANVLAMLPGRESEALAHYDQALILKPDDARIYFSLANVLSKLPGRLPEALAYYQQALELKPRYVEAHVNLANELAKLPGRLPEALAHYEQALQANPNLPEVHYNLAVQLSNLPGREDDAMAHYKEALRLRPDYAKAHNNLATIYARRGRLQEARKHWEKALEVEPNFEDARRNLDLLKRLEN